MKVDAMRGNTSSRKTHTFNRWLLLDKLGALGAILAAAAVPCCFPLLAVVSASLGLAAPQSLRGYMDYAIQGMVLLALLGNLLAYRQHHQWPPFIVGLISVAVVFVAYYAYYHAALVYVGLFGLMVAAVWNIISKRRCATCCFRGNS